MKWIAVAGGLLLGLLQAPPSLSAPIGPVRIETGLVSGAPAKDPSVTVFKGLPYAAPPVGELRWRPPRPPLAWQGVRNADQFGPICPQAPSPNNAGLTISEDCLNLNLWTAAISPAERRPVLVWFHGGKAGVGSADGPQFDGGVLASKGAVVVTVNYRGGLLADLATPDLSRESGHNASGNYGLLDAVAALKWVKNNISAFGGDPDNVTLFGESYGAVTMNYLSISPMAEGLYKRMIVESHVRYPKDPELFTLMSWMPLKDAEAQGVKYADQLGAHSLKALREVPWQKLVEIDRAIPGDPGVILDGWVLPRNFTATYGVGAQHDVFVIAGDNKDEDGASPDTAFDLFASGQRPRVTFPGIFKLSDYLSDARKTFGPMAEAYLKLYPAATDREAALAGSAAARDRSRMSTWLWASTWGRTAKKPIYLYFWTHAPPGPNHDLTGAFHSSEIAYTFANLNPPTAPWTDEDRRIAEVMSSYWVNFAKTGNPNGPGLPVWPAFDGKTPQEMELGDHFGPMPLPDKAKFEFWERFYEAQPAA